MFDNLNIFVNIYNPTKNGKPIAEDICDPNAINKE